MDAKRRHWLQFHDQKTSGIMGLFPLIRGMPVRLTAHINRELGLYKTTKCKIHSWNLNVNEARASFSPQVDIPLSPPSRYSAILKGVVGFSHSATEHARACATARSARQS